MGRDSKARNEVASVTSSLEMGESRERQAMSEAPKRIWALPPDKDSYVGAQSIPPDGSVGEGIEMLTEYIRADILDRIKERIVSLHFPGVNAYGIRKECLRFIEEEQK